MSEDSRLCFSQFSPFFLSVRPRSACPGGPEHPKHAEEARQIAPGHTGARLTLANGFSSASLKFLILGFFLTPYRQPPGQLPGQLPWPHPSKEREKLLLGRRSNLMRKAEQGSPKNHFLLSRPRSGRVGNLYGWAGQSVGRSVGRSVAHLRCLSGAHKNFTCKLKSITQNHNQLKGEKLELGIHCHASGENHDHGDIRNK